MGGGALSLLVHRLFRVWHDGGQLSQRVHPSAAAGSKRRFTAFALSALQAFNPLVSQRAVVHLAVFAWEMPQLQRADFRSIFSGGIADGYRLPGVLAKIWEAITGAVPRILFGIGRADCRYVY